MGTGKSTVSDYLSTEYGMDVVDTDRLIEEREGKSIPDIFAEQGEAYFRSLETSLLIELQSRSNTVISCGGGAAMRGENVAEMKKIGKVVLLTASPETILERVKDSDDRPLLNGNKNISYIAELLEARREKYEAAADLVISTDGRSVGQICGEIMEKLGERKRKKPRLILASASPRRREIMEQVGMKFEIKVSGKEEVYQSQRPDEIVKELSLLKAEDAAEQTEQRNVTIIGADTVVAHRGKILGKPKDDEEAFAMIAEIQGEAHEVYTGVAILFYDENGTKTVVSHAVETKVHVYPMSREEIADYIAAGEHKDKAGSYAIQGKFAPYIEKIEGDYYNVVGLPISYIYQQIKER